MNADSGALDDGTDRHGQLTVGVAANRDALSIQSGAPERRPVEAASALAQLLDGYGQVLDSLAVRTPIMFLSPRGDSRGSFSRRFLLRHANFLASILAIRHIAAHVDILLRRGLRFRALHPHEFNPVDVDRLQDFRNSLSPVPRRTLVLWIVVFALAVAFPVAWITDHIRDLAPQVIVCSPRFSIRAAIVRFVGTAPGPAVANCRPRSRDSLVNVLAHIAHLNLSPGGVIDAFSSARAGGTIAALLLTVIWILSLCTVLLIFNLGFRLKRLAFSSEGHTSAPSRLPRWCDIRSDGLYRLEGDAFSAVGLTRPREFPLDLVARAGILVLPLTISVDFLYTAKPAKLDIVTREILAVAALALIAFIVLQLSWLTRVWRSRRGSRLIFPRRRWLPDGSTVLVNSCTYTALLLATAFIIIEITAISDPGISSTLKVLAILFMGPLIVWSLSSFVWYRLYRELASYGRCIQVVHLRFPMLALVPPLSLAVGSIMAYIWMVNPPGLVSFVAGVLFIVGFTGMPLSVYHMGRNLEQLRRRSPHRDWKARSAGMRAFPLVLVPFAAILYFRHSLNQIFLQITTPDR